jgi:hypothetical protein
VIGEEEGGISGSGKKKKRRIGLEIQQKSLRKHANTIQKVKTKECVQICQYCNIVSSEGRNNQHAIVDQSMGGKFKLER